MSLRTDLLPVVDAARAITGAAQLDQRTSQLTIRTRTWSEGKINRGTKSDSDLVLPQQYKITQATAGQVERLLGSGGSYQPGQHVLVVVTPAWYADDGVTQLGGYTDAQLKPSGSPGVEVLYLITGALSGEFTLVGFYVTRPYRRELLLQRRNASP